MNSRPAHQAEARADFIAELRLDLIEIQRHLPIGTNFPPEEIGDDFFMRRPQAEIALVPVFESEQFLAVEIPAAGFSPEFCGRGHGHQQFLRSGAVHFFANDVFNLAKDPQPEREIGVDACRDLSNHAGAQHEAMADRFSLARGFSQCGD